MTKLIPLSLFFLFLYFPILAQNQAYNAFNIANEATKTEPENYLAPIKALKQIQIDSQDAMAKNMLAQALMTYYSFAGDYQNTLLASESRYGSRARSTSLPTNYDSLYMKEHQFISAKGHILQKAESQQVIMINEAHHIPHHRAFALDLLAGLYEKGFRYFALETLGSSEINEKGYPDFNSGFYSREPLFGELLRTAIKLGFKLIPYENDRDCDNKGSDRFYCNTFRDSIQALNLKERIFAEDPQAKVFVYAGYAHINKGSHDNWKKMAQFFQEMTGINPYCIDQTKLNEASHPSIESQKYRTIMELLKPTSPLIALKNDVPFATSTYVDISVIHPRSTIINDRPDFYSIYGKKPAKHLNQFELKKGHFVQAFYRHENKPRIPADQFIVKTGKEQFFLLPGEYELIIRDQNGKKILQKMISQKDK